METLNGSFLVIYKKAKFLKKGKPPKPGKPRTSESSFQNFSNQHVIAGRSFELFLRELLQGGG